LFDAALQEQVIRLTVVLQFRAGTKTGIVIGQKSRSRRLLLQIKTAVSRDILAGVDQALQQAPIDPQRIGVTGWSYGGFMTMWTVTQTNRFRAAVAGAGIANWKRSLLQNSTATFL
jgi:dienelactone hydrolase